MILDLSFPIIHWHSAQCSIKSLVFSRSVAKSKFDHRLVDLFLFFWSFHFYSYFDVELQ